jgi:hypothetical protein
MKRIDVRCDEQTYAELAVLAKRERRSLHQQVLAVIDAALAQAREGQRIERQEPLTPEQQTFLRGTRYREALQRKEGHSDHD